MNILQMLKYSINTIYVRYIQEENIDSLPIYYIGGNQILPPPLLPEEEEILLKNWQKMIQKQEKYW